MKRLLLASAALTAITAGVHAQADPMVASYNGGCSFLAISDGTDSPQTLWEGEIHVVAVATTTVGTPDPTAYIEVWCELRINGAAPGIPVYEGSGTGVEAGVRQFQFHADPDDVITICDNVWTQAHGHEKDCGDATSGPVVPPPVADAVDEVLSWIDPATCETLAAQSGGPADQPPAFDIRSDGDLYVGEEFVWDCPPYGSSGT